MSYTWFLVLSGTIFIAALMGSVRFRKIAPGFRPFLICLWIGAVNEILSITLQRLGKTTDVNNNIYVLLEAVLILWQLERWGAFDRFRYLFPALLFLFAGTWVTENFVLSSLSQTRPWFRFLYSFIIVILAIQVLNRLIIYERRSLLRHPVFLICTGLIIFFTYKLMIEIFWINGFGSSPGFLINVYAIHAWINGFTNIIYALAVLWMPAKQRFIFPY
jgi:hypothetical protein